MGNGASLNQRRPSAIIGGFRSVEDLVSRGYFQDNIDAYKAAVEDSIRKEALDVLEILVPAGDTRKVLPLHLAASFGRLECCELFISAGFSPLSTDKKGRTPLHLCAMNNTGSKDAGLCATLLTLSGGPKAVNTRDIEGSTPLHIAAQCGNESVVRALVTTRGVKLNHPNGSGKSAKELAKASGHLSIVEIIDDALGGGENSSSGGRKKKKGVVPVDQERIMQVWEKFFENALKACCDEAEAGSTEGLLMLDSNGFNHAKSSIINKSSSEYMSQWAEFHDDDDDAEDGNRRYGNQESNSSGCGGKQRQRRNKYEQQEEKFRDSFAAMHEVISGEKHSSSRELANPLVSSNSGFTNGDDDYRVWDWFCWILCYALVDAGFYTVNSYDGRTLWLEEFLLLQREAGGLCPGDWNDDEGGGGKECVDDLLHHPTTCRDVVERGWITYFDDSSNDCYWYNIPTGNCERCLPLGWDPCSKRLGLLDYEGSSEWLQCPNSYELRNSWVCVVMSSSQYSDHGTAVDDVDVVDSTNGGAYADAKAATRGGDSSVAGGDWKLSSNEYEQHEYEQRHGNDHKEPEAGDSRPSTTDGIVNAMIAGVLGGTSYLSDGDVNDAAADAKSTARSSSSYHSNIGGRNTTTTGGGAEKDDVTGTKSTYYSSYQYDETAATAAAVVDDNNAVTQYYINRITGHSSWYPPEGWDTMVTEQWSGWILCMSEDSGWALFWWNPATGESVWIEEN